MLAVTPQGPTRVLVLGATGMLGSTLARLFAGDPRCQAFATVRASVTPADLKRPGLEVVHEVDALQPDTVIRALGACRPQWVVNCVGVVKQLKAADDPLVSIPLNAILPHRLARICELAGARLVHISTDCVFTGSRGGYREDDPPDATDLYGRSKLLGEVDAPHAVTLRTSIIGHERGPRHGLVEWFLGQDTPVRGFTRAIFSGLTTLELGNVILDRVLPDKGLRGVYHVAAEPIDKYALLTLVASVYRRATPIEPVDQPVIDRSLDGRRFRERTGYVAPPWPELIRAMRDFEAAAERRVSGLSDTERGSGHA